MTVKKPKALHDLQGTSRADRHQPEAPPGRALTEVPPPPDDFDEGEVRAWHALCEALIERGLLFVPDLLAVSAAARSIAALERANAEMRGACLIVQGSAGQPAAHPLARTVIGMHKEVRSWLATLGLTPAARTRVPQPAAAGEDPWMDLVQGGDHGRP